MSPHTNASHEELPITKMLEETRNDLLGAFAVESDADIRIVNRLLPQVRILETEHVANVSRAKGKWQEGFDEGFSSKECVNDLLIQVAKEEEKARILKVLEEYTKEQFPKIGPFTIQEIEEMTDWKVRRAGGQEAIERIK